MPVDIITTKYGYYLPMDGPWQSEDDNEAYKLAEDKFNELKESKDYVALIQSHHEYTHGYWVEVQKNTVEYPDHILKEYTK
jgi:hypothetical protein